MPIALGIDTGGTYTDAVLVNSQTGKIFSTAKSLTTRHDLSLGVEQAIMSVLKERRGCQPRWPPMPSPKATAHRYVLS
jgi:N-methylhydantoinase A/oxoprolinase/acetone carboxylase beta subunit